MQCDLVSALNRHCLHWTSTFTQAHYGFLTYRTATSIQLLSEVLVLFLAANIGFINFDFTRKNATAIGASLTNTIGKKPSGFLSDTKFLGKLNAGNSLASSSHYVHG
jgi:hypothetical protein